MNPSKRAMLRFSRYVVGIVGIGTSKRAMLRFSLIDQYGNPPRLGGGDVIGDGNDTLASLDAGLLARYEHRLANVTASGSHEDVCEYYNERADIFEYDGNMSRDLAERLALRRTRDIFGLPDTWFPE
jgi:hypothetical protein